MDKYDRLKLDNQLCFPLYACSKEVIRRYKPFLDAIDLTYTQYLTMMILWEDKQITVKYLGDKLYLESGTLTPLLKKLESKGYITRYRNPNDERNLIIKITDKGEELKNQALEIPFRMSSCISLEENDLVQLYIILKKLLANFKE